MRISELAAIVGVSVRTIRHYHAVGLMPIPQRVGAFRDYDFEDLALLIRIRSMVQAGLSLKDVQQQLSTTTQPLFDETLADLDKQIANLHRQRTKLIELQQLSSSDVRLSQSISEVFAKVEAILLAEGADDALVFMRRERKLTELFMDLGFFSDQLNETATRLSAQQIADYYLKLQDLRRPDWTVEQCEKLLDDSFTLWQQFAPFDPQVESIAQKFLASKTAEKIVLAAFRHDGYRTFITMAFRRFREDLGV